MSQRSDEELMRAFKGGEGPAFREPFDRYKSPVYGFVLRRITNAARAEEITQDIFMALVKRRNGYEVRSSFRTYLYGIAMNRVASEHRKNKPAQEAEREPTATGNPAVVHQVCEALGQLDPEQREVVMLREYQGLSYQEISLVLNVPVGTVRSRLFRAKLALRELLSPGLAQGA